MKSEIWNVDLGVGLGPLRLGATRDVVVRSLADSGVSLDCDEEDEWFYVDEMDTELNFKSTEPPELLEIVVEDERIRLGPLPVIGERLHKFIDTLKVPDSETVWRTHDYDADERATDGNRPIMTDETLLDRGTLWIPALGLGLGMVRGEIATVRLRRPEESPRRGLGSLTSAQRELSSRKDLPNLLVRPATLPPTAEGRIQKLLTLAVFVIMGALVWQAIAYQARWNIAPMAEGDVIDVQPPPPEPFPDEYKINYRDEKGAQYQVVFKRRDVYVTPQVGDTVEVRYLLESPDRPMGPARFRDAAFDRYLPLGIGVMAVYCVLQLVVPLAGWLLRGRKATQFPHN